MESTEMISPFSRSARCRAISDLPTAVGPAIRRGAGWLAAEHGWGLWDRWDIWRSTVFPPLSATLGFHYNVTGQQEKEQQPADNDADADHLGGGGHAAKIMRIRRVIAAEIFHERTQQCITNEVRGKHLAVEFFAAIEPGEKAIEDEI